MLSEERLWELARELLRAMDQQVKDESGPPGLRLVVNNVTPIRRTVSMKAARQAAARRQ